MVGAIVGGVTTFFAQKKKDKRDDFAELLKGHNDLLAQFKALYTETKQREDKCEAELAKLRAEMIKMEGEIAALKLRMT